MSDVSGCVLQVTDGVSGRRFALRIDGEHADWTLRRLLERYLRDCPLDELLAARRVTPRSAEELRAIQDYVYAVSDEGALLDVYPGVVFWQGGAPIALDDPPVATTVRVSDADVSLIDVAVDRLGAGYDRNWAGFHRRRWGSGRRQVHGVRAGDAGAVRRRRGGRGGGGLAGGREARAAGAGTAGLGQPLRELLALSRRNDHVQDGRRDGAEHRGGRGRHLLGEGAGAQVSHRPAGAAVAVRAGRSGRSAAGPGGQAAGDADDVRLPVFQAVHAVLAARRACV